MIKKKSHSSAGQSLNNNRTDMYVSERKNRKKIEKTPRHDILLWKKAPRQQDSAESTTTNRNHQHTRRNLCRLVISKKRWHCDTTHRTQLLCRSDAVCVLCRSCIRSSSVGCFHSTSCGSETKMQGAANLLTTTTHDETTLHSLGARGGTLVREFFARASTAVHIFVLLSLEKESAAAPYQL